ncbi:aldo/keto reductase [Kordiimonas sp.]|uniref:aldo/keto reductase n=1 Tax=Kordiimonas sp. TaxID=1970157 RepID=UPI003A8EDB00
MSPTRRAILKSALAIGLMPWGLGAPSFARDLIARTASDGGEAIPAVGLGSWITFNVGNDPVGLRQSTAVIEAFFEAGGRLIDSSPMYGSSQSTIGHALKALQYPDGLIAADKVWTSGDGRSQIEESAHNWGLDRFALLQVHNLLDWRQHLPMLFEMKAAGLLRYVGITTSHGRRDRELQQIIRSENIDFVQLTYNLADREAEGRILPLAREKGVAVIANRPFQGGRLIRALKRGPLPDWVTSAGFQNWADFALKYIVSHPAITCTIPATTRVEHVRENMTACHGSLPDAALRQRMVAYVEDL